MSFSSQNTNDAKLQESKTFEVRPKNVKEHPPSRRYEEINEELFDVDKEQDGSILNVEEDKDACQFKGLNDSSSRSKYFKEDFTKSSNEENQA